MLLEPFHVLGPDFDETERTGFGLRVENFKEHALGLIVDGYPAWPKSLDESVDVAWVHLDFDVEGETRVRSVEWVGHVGDMKIAD